MVIGAIPTRIAARWYGITTIPLHIAAVWCSIVSILNDLAAIHLWIWAICFGMVTIPKETAARWYGIAAIPLHIAAIWCSIVTILKETAASCDGIAIMNREMGKESFNLENNWVVVIWLCCWIRQNQSHFAKALRSFDSTNNFSDYRKNHLHWCLHLNSANTKHSHCLQFQNCFFQWVRH